MTAFYNEFDPYAAAWLRNLIDAGHLPAGDVDSRDIRDITPDELRGYTQCHFFAGIGVWALALRRAGWPDDRAVWTGSCPCQPFSKAGRQAGFDDERHLWPAWFHLIDECRPSIIFGEQVAGALDWLDLVSTDLEGSDYAFGTSDLCAAGFSGAHIRQRLYFAGVGNPDDTGPQGRRRVPERAGECASGPRGLDDGESPGAKANMLGRHRVDWLIGRNGQWRPVEPGTFPLADATPSRVGRLRAYGNALDAETATQFIASYLDAEAAGFAAYDDCDLIG